MSDDLKSLTNSGSSVPTAFVDHKTAVSAVATDQPPKLNLIVAHFQEKLEWLHEIDPALIRSLTVYHKGAIQKKAADYGLSWESTHKHIPFEWVVLPNVGRESHTIAWHCRRVKEGKFVCDSSDHTVFLQGDIRDHLAMGVAYPPKDFSKYLSGPYACGRRDVMTQRGRLIHHGKWAQELKTDKMRRAPYEFASYFQAITGRQLSMDGCWWSYQNMFSVVNSRILAHHLNLYNRILATLDYHVNPETGHYFERLSRTLFAGTAKDKEDSDEIWLPILE